MTTPTAETHPYRVGSVVYPTREAALAAMLRTSEAYPAEVIVLRHFGGSVVTGALAATATEARLVDGEKVAR